jgi:hypothetical protein
MRKYVNYIVPVALLLFFFSCRENKGATIVGRWRSIKIENRDKDNFFRSSKEFIDTMGKGNSDDVNMELYGVVNMDSLRHELQIQFDSAYAAQMTIDTQSIFTFSSDSTVILSFPGKNETGEWYINKEGLLILDETNELGQVEHLEIEITSINDENMVLTFVRELEDGLSDTSIVTFLKQKK